MSKVAPPTTQELHQQTQVTVFPEVDEFGKHMLFRTVEQWRGNCPVPTILSEVYLIGETLYEEEGLLAMPRLSTFQNAIEEGRYRDRLLAYHRKAENAGRTLELFKATLFESFNALHSHLPALARTDRLDPEGRPPAFAILLRDAVPNCGRVITDMVLPFYAEPVKDLPLFASLRRQLDVNQQQVSEGSRNLIMPEEYKGDDVVYTYLKGTPFRDLFDVALPFDFVEQLGEHGLVVGASGWGKTELIKNITIQLLKTDDPPSIIILTSQGAMLDAIQKLAIFAPGEPLSERLVIIDPEADPSPALNVFSLPTERTTAYARNIREQVEAGTTEALQYLCASLASELTGKQTTALIFVVSLMISIDGATLTTLRELFEEDVRSIEQSKFADAIKRLDPTAQAFFANQFFTRSFTDTRQQIARRIYRILAVPSFSRMFGSAENRLDMFSIMEHGGICLVNTRKLLMGEDASSLFGRYIISTVLRSAFERVAVQKPRRCLLFIDEASEFCDQSFENLLSKVRQFNVGVLMAFQHVQQIGGVLSSVLANTAVKLCGGLNMHDARVLAGEMRCDPSFIADLKKTSTGTSWACYIRNMTEQAIRLDVPYGLLDVEPRMTEDQNAQLVAENTTRYAVAPQVAVLETTDESTELPSPAEPALKPPSSPTGPTTAPGRPPATVDIDADIHTRPSKEW